MPSKKQYRKIAFELIVIISSAIVDMVITVSLIFLSAPVFWFQIIFPSTIAIIIPFALQAHNKWVAMPRLEIKYESNRKSQLYELYHHKDVPISIPYTNERDENAEDYIRKASGESRQGAVSLYLNTVANFILIGLKNIGNSCARNCYAKLWIYSDHNLRKPFDNPFTLYLSHDPNSIRFLPPSTFDLSAGDEQFLAICHFEQ